MTFLNAVVLGIVQGLTEFLPISSSGHLVLLQRLFGLHEGVLTFDIAVHVATLVAVAVVLWDDLLQLIRRPFSRLTLMIIVGTIPTVIIGFTFKDMFEGLYQSGKSLGFEFVATGLILIMCERAKRGEKVLETMSWKDAVIIGAAQGLAILPAISRSGLTIAGALFRGFDRRFAARYSFLLSMPAIFGSAVLDLPDAVKGSLQRTNSVTEMSTLIVGMICAGIFGFISVKWMQRILVRGSLKPFAYYVIILGALVLAEQLVSGRFFGKLF